LISAATAGRPVESRIVQVSSKLIINSTWSSLIIVICPFILKKKIRLASGRGRKECHKLNEMELAKFGAPENGSSGADRAREPGLPGRQRRH